MTRKPRIAVMMDENTSSGGDRYDLSKAYFLAIHRAGGLPFGIPYFADLIDPVIAEYDGYLSVGGTIHFPPEWYLEGDESKYPHSDRFAVDAAMMSGFLERDKPVLGICNGMQTLACLNGCRMVSAIRDTGPHILQHQQPGGLHPATIKPGTLLARILDRTHLDINSRHREAIVEISDTVVASAHAPDGVIEAVELPSRRFALGLQWHPEAFAMADNPGNRIFTAFVEAASRR